MEIGLKAFIQIADILQIQKESMQKEQMPLLPTTFLTPPNECLSVYLSNQLSAMNKRVIGQHGKENEEESSSNLRVMLNETLAREIGIINYFEPVRRAFQVRIYHKKLTFEYSFINNFFL